MAAPGNSLNTVGIQEFYDQWVVEPQAFQKLMNTTREIHGVIGDAFQWPVISPVVMDDRGAPNSNIPPSFPTHTKVITTFERKVKNLPVDAFLQAEVNVDAITMYVQELGWAMGRFQDQFKIDALTAATTSPLIVDGGTNMSVNKVLNAKRLLDLQNVPEMNRYALIGANEAFALLQETEVINANYNTTRVLSNGQIDTFLGFKFFTIGNYAEGGLPVTAGIETNFFWHMNAIGYASQIEPTVRVWENVPAVSAEAIAHMSAGASVLLPDSIVRVNCDISSLTP